VGSGVKKAFEQSSSATSGITAYSLEGQQSQLQRCELRPGGQQGWRWGSNGACYATQAEAESAVGAGYDDSSVDRNKTAYSKGDVRMNGPTMFARLTKVDEEKRLVYGLLADETPDRADEVFDYDTSKPYFKRWSAEVHKDTGGASVGNLRAMHGKVAAGKFTEIDFDDAAKQVTVVAKVVDDNEWNKVVEGVYSGFSIGGSYVGQPTVQKVNGRDIKRYTANPSEGSLVDRPCNPAAKFFEVRKLDGSVETHEFQNIEQEAPREYAVEGSDEDVAKLQKVMTEGQMTVADVLEMAQRAAARKLAKAIADDEEEKNETYEEGMKEATSDIMTSVPQMEVSSEAKFTDGLGAAEATARESERKSGGTPGKTPDHMTDMSDYNTANNQGPKNVASGPDKGSGGASSVKSAGGNMGKAFPKKGVNPFADKEEADEDPKEEATESPDEEKAEVEAAKETPPVKGAKPKKGVNPFADKALQSYGVTKAGSVDKLVEHWAKWGGTFEKTLSELSEHKDISNLEATTAWLCHKASGKWPEERKNSDGLLLSDLEKLAGHSQHILVKHGIVKPELFGGTYSVTKFADLLDQIAWLRTACEKSDVSDRLDSTLEEMCELMCCMADEEGVELFSPKGDLLTTTDVMKLAYAPNTLRKVLNPLLKEGRRHGAEDLKRVQAIHDLSKDLSGCANTMQKIGARNSKVDMEKLQKIHDHATMLGGACDPDTNKAQVVGDLSKVADPEELRKIIEASIQAAVAPLHERNEQLEFEIRKYAAAPQKPRGFLVAVSKEQDNQGLGKGVTEPTIEPITTGIKEGGIDEAATMMKKVHATGGSPWFKRGE
jgi:hypothetical protein